MLGSSGHEVQHTRELARILELRRRTWKDGEAEAFAIEVSARLRRPNGTQTLRPIQAVSLFELATYGGLCGLIGVGEGKTLISLLAAVVTKARRPLILTRANLVDKTWRDIRELSYHWPIPTYLQIKSYEILGRANRAELLIQYSPDLIVADEAHRLKNLRKCAAAKRVARYMAAKPTTIFAAMSGTLTRKSWTEFAHILKWTHKPYGAPVPDPWSELEDWAGALDETPDGDPKVGPGALYLFANAIERAEPDPLIGIRSAMRRRLIETPGVVATTTAAVGASLLIEAVETDMLPATDEAFTKLRNTWFTPDDWPVSDPMQLTAHLRQLALGFFYKWDPRPPLDWIEARKLWAAFCRHILTNNRRDLDSELQVVNAVDAGHYPEAVLALKAWREIEPTFTPNTVPVWLDDSVINLATDWAIKSGPGIIWTEHRAFAERLARKANLTYYGEGGYSTAGKYIEDHPAGESLIASIPSNSEGKNLQIKWSRNLVTSWPASGQTAEQLLGRTHRQGQLADEVVFNPVLTCVEHSIAFERSRNQARYVKGTSGQDQRLLFADTLMPTPDEIALRSGPRWIRNR